MTIRNLTKNEKKKLLSKIEKPVSVEIERVLDLIEVPSQISDEDFDQIREMILNHVNSELPRSLTKKEIEEIVSVLPVLPCTVKKIALHNNKTIREKLAKQLSYQKFLVKEGTIDRIKKQIYEIFLRTVLPAGTSVGSIGGMSVSEKIIQAMLDSIHSGGGKNTKEMSYKMITNLIEIGKPTDIMRYIVHFKDKNLTSEEIKVIGEMFRGVNVSDFVMDTEILQNVPDEDLRYYRNYNTILSATDQKGIVEPDKIKIKFLRINLDINKCFMYDVSPNDIVEVIKANTEDDDFESTIRFVVSPLSRGFIDIHGDQEYMEYSISKFSTLGTRIGECDPIKPDPDQGDMGDPGDLSLNEMAGIFLKVILEDCLSDMKVKGMNGVTDVIPSDTIHMEKTFSQKYVFSGRETEKFSSEPYNMKLSQIKRLWNINIDKEYLYFEGITIDKVRNMFEVCGIEIIEDDMDNNYFAVVMMPEKRNEKIYNDEGEVEYKYIKVDGKYYMNDKEHPDNKYGPKERVSDLRNFEKETLSRKIVSYRDSKEEEFLESLPEFSPIYRGTSYNYAFIEGEKIRRDLFSNKIIDKRYIFPENTRAVKDLFGIEGARFYLTKKYLSIDFVRSVHPYNINLLIDFQTFAGTLIPIKSRQIYKEGNSILAEASFEQQSTVFKNASAFGDEDDITSVGSRVITGIPCKNGTGIVEVSYDPFYLNDKENKVIVGEEDEEESKMFNDDVLGPCLSAGTYVLPKDDLEAESVDDPPTLIEQDKKPLLTIKEEVPSPPRTRPPRRLTERERRTTTIFKGDRVNIDALEDIMDEPEFDEDEFIFDI